MPEPMTLAIEYLNDRLNTNTAASTALKLLAEKPHISVVFAILALASEVRVLADLLKHIQHQGLRTRQ